MHLLTTSFFPHCLIFKLECFKLHRFSPSAIKWIRKTECNYRIQHFLWLALQSRLPNGDNFFKHHISASESCEWCSSYREDASCASSLYSSQVLLGYTPLPLPLYHTNNGLLPRLRGNLSSPLVHSSGVA